MTGQVHFGFIFGQAACSPYFSAMFSGFEERNLDKVTLGDVDPDALRVLVDYVYTAEVEVTEDNVQVSQGGGVSVQTSDFNVVRFWGSIDMREAYETFLF